MIVKKYVEMLGRKSAIRELFDYGAARAKEVGYENVFDYSPVSYTHLIESNAPTAFVNYLRAVGRSGIDCFLGFLDFF